MRSIVAAFVLLLAYATAADAAIGFTNPSNGSTIVNPAALPITISGTHTGAAVVFLRIEQDPVPPAFPPPNGVGGATLSVATQVAAATWQTDPLYLLNGTYRLTVSSNVDFPVSIEITVNIPGNPGFLACVTDPTGLGVQAPAINWNRDGPGAPAVNFNFRRSATAPTPELFAAPTSYPAGTPFVCGQNTAGHTPRVLIFGGDPGIDVPSGFSGWSFDSNTSALTARVSTVGGTLPFPLPLGTPINSMIAGLFAMYDDDPNSPGILPKMTGSWLAANAAFTFTPVMSNGKIVALNLTLDGPKFSTAFFKAYFPTSMVNAFFGPSCNSVPSPSILPLSAQVNNATVTAVGTLGCELEVEVMFQSPVSITVPTVPPPPAVTVPAPIVTNATSGAGAVVTFAASATGFDGAEPVTCVPSSGSTFPLGTTDLNCSATDSFGTTGSASFSVTVRPVADLELTKQASAGSVQLGSTLTYTLTATNHGPSDATNISIADQLPSGFTVIESQSSPDCVYDANNLATCAIAILHNGDVAVRTITGTTVAAGTLTNAATVYLEQTDPQSGNNTAQVSTAVIGPNPIAVISAAIAKVLGLGFQQSANLLQNAVRNINGGNTAAACNQVSAFARQVRAQTGKALSRGDAADLLDQASAAMALLGCR